MNINYQDYSLFLRFIEKYRGECFRSIDRQDSLVHQLEKMTEVNDQYFFVADLFQSKILFSSNRSLLMIGVNAEELTPDNNLEAVHPEEVYRNLNGWAKLLKMANDLINSKNGPSLLSVNMKMRNPQGTYSEILFQCKLFRKEIPQKKVCALLVLTNIDSFKMRKHGYHYYVGSDLSLFRYPDSEMLQIGNEFTNREFEIIRLIEAGLNTDEIAKELFLSVYTVNTHRGNILKKSNNINIFELINNLKDKGIL